MEVGTPTVCISCGCQIAFTPDGRPVDAIMKNTKLVGKGSKPQYNCCGCNRLAARIYKLQTDNASLRKVSNR